MTYEQRKAIREECGIAKYRIEVWGTGRDYDCTPFCCDHNVEAERCAAEWCAELIDGLEDDGEGNVTIKVRRWAEGDECSACNPGAFEP